MAQYHVIYSSTTKSLQALKNAITEIVSTGELTDSDILSIRYWMDDNKHLSGNYPFDSIYSIIDNILSDGVIDPEERQLLLSTLQDEKICNPAPFLIKSLAGCHICLTGNFSFAKRKEIESLLIQYCAFIEKNTTTKTDYVFVGGLGSNDWAYGNYGNKIKRAKELQELGHRILIFSEDVLKDFLDTHIPPDTYTFEQCISQIDTLSYDAQKIIQEEICHIIDGFPGITSQNNETINLLINKNILCKVEDDYPYQFFLRYLSRNELNKRIESLNLKISFNKNMKLDDLIEWCVKNIPEHIKTLCSDFMFLKLNDSFLNPAILIRLQQYLFSKYPE